MNTRKKLGKKMIAFGAIVSFGASFALASPNGASAEQIYVSENNYQKELKTDTAILDWRDPLNNAVDIIGKNLGVAGSYQGVFLPMYPEINYEHFSVEADGSPTITNSTNIFVGKTTLTNNSDQEQTLSTNSFSKMISNSVSHSTTHGFKFGTKASAKFNIPFVGETGIELSAEYNFSDTSSQTNTESFTYTASPQNIKVPAHSSVEVLVNLNTVKANGNVKLLAKMSGTGMGQIVYFDPDVSYSYNMSLNEIAKRASIYENLQNLTANPDGKTINLLGDGKYEAEYGTEFSVTVKPIDKNGKSINEGYTYNVTPEITNIK